MKIKGLIMFKCNAKCVFPSVVAYRNYLNHASLQSAVKEVNQFSLSSSSSGSATKRDESQVFYNTLPDSPTLSLGLVDDAAAVESSVIDDFFGGDFCLSDLENSVELVSVCFVLDIREVP